MSKTLLQLTVFCVIFVSCNTSPEEKKVADSKDPRVAYQYYADGKVKAEIHFDDFKRFHGEVKKFYPGGQLKSLLTYEHGVTLNAKQYYENGNLEMDFPYKKGKKHGKRSKYWESGSIQSVLEYQNGKPVAGLVEYKESGEVVTTYPSLQIEQINNINKNGEYYIDVFFSSNPQKGIYYIGRLENGIIPRSAQKIRQIKDGKGRIVLNSPPNSNFMKEINIIGRFKTGYGSIYIIEKTFDL